jgi:hypothetical protein
VAGEREGDCTGGVGGKEDGDVNGDNGGEGYGKREEVPCRRQADIYAHVLIQGNLRQLKF